MSLINILVFSAAALIISLAAGGKWRNQFLLVSSLLAIYWLQPSILVRNLDFWLPTLTVLVTVIGWILVTPADIRSGKDNWITGLIVILIILGIGLTRFISLSGFITASRPPPTAQILLGLGFSVLVILFVAKFPDKQWRIDKIYLIGLVLILVLLKTPAFDILTGSSLRLVMGQDPVVDPSITYIKWLGFSYVSFRLIHTLRDGAMGRLPVVSLNEYIVYVIFFPSFSAGPIDRLERFIKDLRSPFNLNEAEAMYAFRRMVNGLAKKFILADSIALVALNPLNADQVHSPGWMWIIVYLYAFQIYFDFSGYTDIAIAIGRLMGIHLPENFNHPYLKQNLTQFWNNWHMTLTQWLRGYFFFPLTRSMMRSNRRLPNYVIALIAQLSTMILIGLWHGVTVNYFIWGLWHGIGLFINNRWIEKVNLKVKLKNTHPLVKMGVGAAGVFITFNFVTLGWVWFALPRPELSFYVFGKLLGLN